ncbi:MAG: protein kinase [Planctomycetaceae bacterium]|nr:protein kinase [Planctomycetaceae bacterium]
MDHDSAHQPHGAHDDADDALESDVTVIGSASSITPQVFPLGLTSRELSHALRGEMLGHFLLQHYIGGGGMGVVFKALDTTLDRIVAVKVVSSQRVDNEDLQRRFLIEAQSTARLDHPNIARVHYIGRDRGLPYIVFEFIDGENIRDVVADRGPLPVAESVSYVYQIAHALAHAWQREVVHRDIKPSNILVTADGQAKLVDMGLARLRQMNDETEEDLTATGITLGTFDYISPEQARDPRLADARSDIYSLGCTLFYMLAGRAPFAQGTALQKLLQHQSDRPPDLRSFRGDIPDSVSRVVRRMLAKAPADRHQTPIDLIADLAEILEELDTPLPFAATTLPWTMPARTVPRWRKHALWSAPLAALLLFGFVADRLTRTTGVAAPFFPPLEVAPDVETPAPSGAPRAAADSPAPSSVRLMPLEASIPIGVAPAAQAPVASPPSTGASATVVSTEAAPTEPPAAFSLDEPWEMSKSLWDIVSNWPPALDAALPANVGGSPAGEGAVPAPVVAPILPSLHAPAVGSPVDPGRSALPPVAPAPASEPVIKP